MNSNNGSINRVVFNFMSSCEMNCDFCYIPFDFKGVGTFDLWSKIIGRCKELNVDVITFGGGDPFSQEQFVHLLETLDLNDLFIQIDTNGLNLKEEHRHLIVKSIDLIGLPIDGTSHIHKEMRKNAIHYDVVINWIHKLTDLGVNVKVNTVVTKKNIHFLENLAIVLSSLSISAWSLYQFWPIGPCKKNRKKFEVSTDEFLRITNLIKKKYNFTTIEASTIDDRVLSYFFVNSLGCVYAINSYDFERYTKIGSIFDDDILNKWELHGSKEKVTSRAKQRKKIIK